LSIILLKSENFDELINQKIKESLNIKEDVNEFEECEDINRKKDEFFE
jgi:hypothetical protein